MTYHRVHFHRHQFVAGVEMKLFGFDHHKNRDPWDGAPHWALELGLMLGIVIENQETLMTALDTLKTDVAALIAEATADITAAIAAAQAASNDPAIDALDQTVTAATKTLHDQFAATTGTPVPATPQP